MNILVFGLENEDALLSQLRKKFPAIGFKKYDLKSDLEEEGRDLIVIDTVKGISHVELLEGPHEISPGKALEGSGALMTLRILLRLGSIDSVRVIAIPHSYPIEEAFEEMASILEVLLKSAR